MSNTQLEKRINIMQLLDSEKYNKRMHWLFVEAKEELEKMTEDTPKTSDENMCYLSNIRETTNLAIEMFHKANSEMCSLETYENLKDYVDQIWSILKEAEKLYQNSI